MSTTTTDSVFMDNGRVHIKRLPDDADGNYRLHYPMRGFDAAIVGWLSFQPSGVPFAFGDPPTTLELGGTADKSVEYVGDVERDSDGNLRAAGARVRLGDDA
jgi:hypothetical protein